jgi:hypothetical protein
MEIIEEDPNPTLKTTRKRGINPGSMVSQDLSYKSDDPKYLTTEYNTDIDLLTDYPNALIPTGNRVIINAKGDWNTNNAFRPEYIELTFNLKIDYNEAMGCGSPIGPPETINWFPGQVDVINANEKTLTPSCSYNAEYSYTIPNYSARLRVKQTTDGKCSVKIPLEWKINNPNVSNVERRLDNVVLDFGGATQWVGMGGTPFSIEDIKFGYYSDEPIYNLFHDSNQLIIKNSFLDQSKYATPITVTNATINDEPDYVLFGDTSIIFSGAGEQLRVSYNPSWAAPFNVWYLWVFVYFPQGVNNINAYADVNDNIVRIDYENINEVGVKYPLFAWDDNGAGRGAIGTEYNVIVGAGLNAGWHLLSLSGGSHNPWAGLTINPHTSFEIVSGSIPWEGPGNFKLNTIGYDSFTSTGAEQDLVIQSLVFSHSKNGWPEEEQNRLYYDHLDTNKMYYDPIYEEVVFIVKADGSFEDVTNGSTVTVEDGLTTQTIIKKFGDAASAGNGWLRVTDRLSTIDNLSMTALGLRDISIDGWFYHPSLGLATDEALFGADTIYNTPGWSLEIVGDDIVLMVNDVDHLSAPHGMVQDTWYKIGLHVNNLQLVVTVDDNEVITGSGVALGDWYGADFAIGARGHSGLKQFTGYFQNVRFTKWSRLHLDKSIFEENDVPLLKLSAKNMLMNIKGYKNIDSQVIDLGPYRLLVNNLDLTSNYNALYGNDSDYGFVSDPDYVLRQVYTGPFTIFFTIHRAANSYGTILSTAYTFVSQTEANRGYMIQMPNDSSIIFKRRDTQLTPEYVTLTGTIPPADGVFHTCRFTYDGINLRYYLDGVLDATVAMEPFYDYIDNNLVLFSPNWDTMLGSIGPELGTGGTVKIQNIQIYNNVVLD